jgi:hypothetical protein
MQSKFDELARYLWIALFIIIAIMVVYLLRRWLLIPMMVALLLVGVSLPLLLWVRSTNQQASSTGGGLFGKNKRDQIDAALRKLSDEELMDLRERISTGEVTDDTLYRELLGEDKELIDER